MAERNPDLVIHGQPRTVEMRGKWTLANGEKIDRTAPLEVWISALVDILSPEQRAQFATRLDRIMEVREHQRILGNAARTVATINMPNVGG